MLIINKWYGRLGNNIIQLINSIYIARYLKHNIIKFPKHSYFVNDFICIDDIDSNDNKIVDTFFADKRDKLGSQLGIPLEIFDEHIDISCLSKIFRIKSKANLSEKDLIIHIRSGDVYSNNPHPGWVQPPLDFYIKIINSYEWENIQIICEDRKTPILNKLLEIYGNIKFKQQSLDKDIEVILGAKSICFGWGSFIPSLLLFNDSVKNLYYPLYCDERDFLKYTICNKYTTELPGYIKRGSWKNNKEQIDIMINYKIPKNTTFELPITDKNKRQFNYKGIDFLCNIMKANNLVVMFHGTSKFKDYPVFRGYNYNFKNTVVMSIADPLIKYYNNIKIGWYFNTVKYPDTFKNIVEIISIVKNKCSADNVIFVSNCSGAMIALKLACYFKQKVCIANPHIILKSKKLWNYWHFQDYALKTGYHPGNKSEGGTLDPGVEKILIGILKDNNDEILDKKDLDSRNYIIKYGFPKQISIYTHINDYTAEWANALHEFNRLNNNNKIKITFNHKKNVSPHHTPFDNYNLKSAIQKELDNI